MAKLVWRVKLVAEVGPELVSETDIGRIERDDRAAPETLGLTLDEGKQLVSDSWGGDRGGGCRGRVFTVARHAAAIQAEIVRVQVKVRGRALPMVGVRPLGWTGSSGSFDRLPGVLILELHGAEVTESRVQPS